MRVKLGRSRLSRVAEEELQPIIEEEEAIVKLRISSEQPAAIPCPNCSEKGEPVFGFLFLGFVGNLCFNFLIQEMSYFNFIFGPSFGGLCGFAYAILNNIGQLVVVWIGASFSFTFRVCFSCLLIGTAMAALPALAYFELPFMLVIALILVGIMGFGTAILSSAGFGLTALCTPRIRQYYNVGTSLPGMLALPQMLLMNCVFKNGFHLSADPPNEFQAASLDMATTLALLASGSLCLFLMAPFFALYLVRTKPVVEAIQKINERKSALIPQRPFIKILGQTLPLALAVWTVMFFSMSVFPDQVTTWETDTPKRYPGGEFGYQNILIYTFQVADVLARFLVVSGVTLSATQVMIGSALRIVLVPLFLLASAEVSIFDNDIVRFILIATMGITYGLVLAWGMILGPNQVRANEADTAGYIMSFFLVNGILFGSTLAFLIRFIPKRIAESQAYSYQCAFKAGTYDVVCVDPESAAVIT